MTTPTIDQLKRSLEIAQQIAGLESEMAAIFQGQMSSPKASASPTKRTNKSKRSAETIARMAAAQQKRWAKVRSGKESAAAEPKRKGGLTEEGRKRMAAAMKKRWAEAKKSGASVLGKKAD